MKYEEVQSSRFKVQSSEVLRSTFEVLRSKFMQMVALNSQTLNVELF